MVPVAPFFNSRPPGPWWVEGGLEGSRSTTVFIVLVLRWWHARLSMTGSCLPTANISSLDNDVRSFSWPR